MKVLSNVNFKTLQSISKKAKIVVLDKGEEVATKEQIVSMSQSLSGIQTSFNGMLAYSRNIAKIEHAKIRRAQESIQEYASEHRSTPQKLGPSEGTTDLSKTIDLLTRKVRDTTKQLENATFSGSGGNGLLDLLPELIEGVEAATIAEVAVAALPIAAAALVTGGIIYGADKLIKSTNKEARQAQQAGTARFGLTGNGLDGFYINGKGPYRYNDLPEYYQNVASGYGANNRGGSAERARQYVQTHNPDGTLKTTGSRSPSNLSGRRAMGGRVQRGKAYIVGERGPEIFIPGESGTISPRNNDATKELKRMAQQAIKAMTVTARNNRMIARGSIAAGVGGAAEPSKTTSSFMERIQSILSKVWDSIGKTWENIKDRISNLLPTGFPFVNPGSPRQLQGRNAENFRMVMDKARAYGDPHPELTAAQAQQESGYGTAGVGAGINNLFGQTTTDTDPRKSRKVVDKNGIVRYFKIYPSADAAIKEHVEKWNKRLMTEQMTPAEALAVLLNNRYAGDPNGWEAQTYPAAIAAILRDNNIDFNKPYKYAPAPPGGTGNEPGGTPVTPGHGASPLPNQTGSMHIQGNINVNGMLFPFGSGGHKGFPSIPYGTYPLQYPGTGPLAQKLDGIGINNNVIWDPVLRRNRLGIIIHPTSDNNTRMVTQGCVAIPRKFYRSFRDRVLDVYYKTGGASITVGPNGAWITGRGDNAQPGNWNPNVKPKAPPKPKSTREQAELGSAAAGGQILNALGRGVDKLKETLGLNKGNPAPSKPQAPKISSLGVNADVLAQEDQFAYNAPVVIPIPVPVQNRRAAAASYGGQLASASQVATGGSSPGSDSNRTFRIMTGQAFG